MTDIIITQDKTGNINCTIPLDSAININKKMAPYLASSKDNIIKIPFTLLNECIALNPEYYIIKPFGNEIFKASNSKEQIAFSWINKDTNKWIHENATNICLVDIDNQGMITETKIVQRSRCNVKWKMAENSNLYNLELLLHIIDVQNSDLENDLLNLIHATPMEVDDKSLS